MNINRIIISGNLVANPILRETNSGTPVASATIANNEFFNDGEGERQQVTTFVDVTVWGKSGENFASLAKKGQEVIIEGQLRRNDWESEDGQKHSKHFLRAENWQFTQYRRQEESAEFAPEKEIKETKKTAPKKLRKSPSLNRGAHNAPGNQYTTPQPYSQVMSLYSNYLPKTRGAVALLIKNCAGAPKYIRYQPIDTVSDRYSFLPTSSVLKGMRETGWLSVRGEQQSVRTEARRGFQKHLIRFAGAEHLGSWEKNQVRPEVVLLNSHDKSSAYQLYCGLFRLVCPNGMVVSHAKFHRISIKHFGFNPDSVIEASFKVLGAVPDIMNKVRLFQDRILTDAERLALATGAATYRWQDPKKASVSPSMLSLRDALETEQRIFGPP